jgi:hypothetical protein
MGKKKNKMTTAFLMIEEIMGKGNLTNPLLKAQKAVESSFVKSSHNYTPKNT